MTTDPQTLAEILVAVSHRVEAKGLVAATDGNLSVRLPGGNILTTPTSVNKGMIQLNDLVEVTAEGIPVSGACRPSTELKMHLFIYRQRPDVHAVIHCHPVYATGFAAAGIPLKENVFPEVIVALGKIPLAPYATPSTDELGESLRPFVHDYSAVLLANHGVVTFGKDLWSALFLMEKVEQTAHMLFVAEMLGGARSLPQHHVQRLKELATTVYQH